MKIAKEVSEAIERGIAHLRTYGQHTEADAIAELHHVTSAIESDRSGSQGDGGSETDSEPDPNG